MQTLTVPTRSGSSQRLSASIDDSVKIPTSAPLDCPTILSTLATDPSLTTSFNIPAILTNLQTFNTTLSDPLVLSTQAITDTTTLSAINAYLTHLRTTDYLKIQQIANCSEEQNAGTSQIELQEQEQITEESKSRLAAITAPETHVSYYESWFPRPMKQDTLFALFGIALFLLLVSVVFFLGMGGIEFQILMPSLDAAGIDFSILTSRIPVLIAGVATGVVIGVTGHYLKWF